MYGASGLTKLNITILLTSTLIFGAIAGLLGLVLLLSGVSGSGAIILWLIVSILFISLQWYFGPSIIKWAT